MTERLHFHFSLSCIGEGNGNPLQCSCLENSRDEGAWWAAIYGVAQSWTRMKLLSSSSSRNAIDFCILILHPDSLYLFIISNSLLMASLGFSMYNIMLSTNQRRQWHPTPVLLPRKSHGWKSLVGCSPWGH